MEDRDSKGRFVAGNNANPKGRPKGKKKRKAKKITDAVNSLEEMEIFHQAQLEVTMRLLDLVHSDNEAIALEAIKEYFHRTGFILKLFDKYKENIEEAIEENIDTIRTKDRCYIALGEPKNGAM